MSDLRGHGGCGEDSERGRAVARASRISSRNGSLSLGLAAALLVIVFLMLGCGDPERADDARLATEAVEFLSVEHVRNFGLVFDRSEQLTPLSALATEAFKKRLAEAAVSWQEVDLQGSAMNLPGEWAPAAVPRQYHRCNKSHSWMSIELRRKGRRAELEWFLNGGRLCGHGQVIELTWVDGAWSGEVVKRWRS